MADTKNIPETTTTNTQERETMTDLTKKKIKEVISNCLNEINRKRAEIAQMEAKAATLKEEITFLEMTAKLYRKKGDFSPKPTKLPPEGQQVGGKI